MNINGNGLKETLSANQEPIRRTAMTAAIIARTSAMPKSAALHFDSCSRHQLRDISAEVNGNNGHSSYSAS